MQDTKQLNFKLKELYHLVDEIQALAPDSDQLPNEWNNVFYHIDELERHFRKVSYNMALESFHDAELVISGTGTKLDFLKLEQSLMDEFPEFSFEDSYASQLPETFLGDFQLHYKGLYIGDLADFVGLPSHAEALFDDTGVTNIRAEVCADGEWYGRTNKLSFP